MSRTISKLKSTNEGVYTSFFNRQFKLNGKLFSAAAKDRTLCWCCVTSWPQHWIRTILLCFRAHYGLLRTCRGAYLEQQHTSPGQTNLLHTPSANLGGQINTSLWTRRGEEWGRKRNASLYFKRSQGTYLPSNLCFKKSNSAFCIMSVTCREKIQEGRRLMSTDFLTVMIRFKGWRSFDAPRSPSVTVQPEPRAAWKAQRRMEECVQSLENRGRNLKKELDLRQDKRNTITNYFKGWKHSEEDHLKALAHCGTMKRGVSASQTKHKHAFMIKIWYFILRILNVVGFLSKEFNVSFNI